MARAGTKLKHQVEFLSRKYHCVVTNPPYMGSKGMNDQLRRFIEEHYNRSKADLMTCFMQRCVDLIYDNCLFGIINLPSWLFLGSFEELRKSLLSHYYIDSLLHMGRGIFGIDFGSVAFVISKAKSNSKGSYFRLHQRNFQHIYFQHIEQLFLRAKNHPDFRYDFKEYRDEEGVSEIPLESSKNGLQLYYPADQMVFNKIPGSPIGYWASSNIIKAYDNVDLIENLADVRQGLATCNNSLFTGLAWSKVIQNWF
ncbi:MAG: N-6 DNA methylase [Ignavibacteria bacterium]|nr:N-6 DNA methylase [Ignavibacteria bacterium]